MQIKMMGISCVIGQISSNLFKIDATIFQIPTYRSSMIVNEISSLWFIKNFQIPLTLTPKRPRGPKCHHNLEV